MISMMYHCEKQPYRLDKISEMYVFFENGDYLTIHGIEVDNLKINTYCKLARYHNGFAPIAKSGFIKTKISAKKRFSFDKCFLADEDEFKRDRKSYIENRCIDGIITAIWLFDSNRWHNVLLGNVKAEMQDEYLVFEFFPCENVKDDDSAKNDHYVYAHKPRIVDIFKIHLDFENCDGIDVFQDEISEFNLNYSDSLDLGDEFHRIVDSGYMIVKFDKTFHSRDVILIDTDSPKTKDLIKRLCGKSGESTHDICHLYVDYHHAGYGNSLEECFEVEDVYCYAHANTDIGDGEDLYKTDDLDDDFDDDDDNGDDYIYIGGYAKRLKDSSIVIAFGRNAETTVQKICAR